MNDSKWLVALKTTQINLAQIADDVHAYASAIENTMDEKDDSELMDLDDDANRVKEAADRLHSIVYQSKWSRMTMWEDMIRNTEGVYKKSDVIGHIEALARTEGFAPDATNKAKQCKWHGYQFKVHEHKEVYLLRIFEVDQSRDVVELDPTTMEQPPKPFHFVGILAERKDIEGLAVQAGCSVYDFLVKETTDTSTADIVAFHLT